jgi:hypothetical protein
MRRLAVALMLLRTLAAADAAGIRDVLRAYRQAVRAGGAGQLAFLSPRFRVFLPYGHIFETLPVADPLAPRGQGRSEFVVSVYEPEPDRAVAASVWRDGADAGLADYTLAREAGRWKIVTSRDGFLPAAGPFAADRLGAQWESLFDGKTFSGWETVAGRPVPGVWRIDDGCLVTVAGEGAVSLRTRRAFTSFELEWEWKVATGANSGVKYRLYAVRSGVDAVGMEYQLADDAADPGARVDPEQRSGALYGVTAMDKSGALPVGQWNRSRIVVAREHVEHWLNGVKTAEYPVDLPFASPISLQHHRSEVRFRNLRIRAVDQK